MAHEALIFLIFFLLLLGVVAMANHDQEPKKQSEPYDCLAEDLTFCKECGFGFRNQYMPHMPSKKGCG